MKIVKPSPKTVEVGSDQLGYLSVESRGYITIDERAFISQATANRKTDDALVKEKAESLAERGFDYPVGDLIDYISDRSKMPQSVVKKFDKDKLLQETLGLELTDLQKAINLNFASTIKAFIERRLLDADLKERVSTLSVEEFAYGDAVVREEFGAEAELCGLGLRGLLDHIGYFYIAESRCESYRNLVDTIVKSGGELQRFF